ncbi:MAG: chloride channel protein [Candidatus Alcyoniella australis]|nr:chloride channel protein [Candidatus Alcyoniella australis]
MTKHSRSTLKKPGRGAQAALLRVLYGAMDRLRLSETAFIVGMAAFVGLAAGYGGVAFREMLELARRFFCDAAWYLKYVSVGFDSPEAALAVRAQIESVHMLGGANPLGFLSWPFLIGVCAFGGLLVAPMVFFLAREAKGHGVPEVMDAIARRGGLIRVRVVLVKAVASVLSIATGASVGSEGPIVQIGSAIGSSVGQFFRVARERMTILVGCGAAGGIAVIFNAPIAGIMFALEVILGDFTVGTLSAVVISAVMATVVRHVYYADEPVFHNMTYEYVSIYEVGTYMLLGLIAGLIALLYVRMVYKLEDAFDDSRIPRLLRPALGGALVGVIAVFFPQVLGVGYESIDLALTAQLGLGALVALALLKLAATALSIGSGASGGIFAPSLFIGAMTGGAVGMVVHTLFPEVTAPTGAYALVGMAAVFAAATHAPITAILILFEMTLDYKVILPVMLAVIMATMVKRALMTESIYTLKLARKGVRIHAGREETIMKSLCVREVMRADAVKIRHDMPFNEVVEIVLSSPETMFFVVDSEGMLKGEISLHTVKDILQEQGLDLLVLADDVMTPAQTFVTPDTTLAETMRRFSARHTDVLPVVESKQNPRFVGVLSRAVIIDAYNREILRQSALGIRYLRGGSDGRTVEAVELPVEFITREISIPQGFVGMTLQQLDLRTRHGVTVLAVRHPGGGPQGDEMPDPQKPLTAGDRMVVVGRVDDLNRLED